MDEIPEWAIRDADQSLKGIYPKMVSAVAFLHLREAIARALAEKHEADCRAVCGDCSMGRKLELKGAVWMHHIDSEGWVRCRADPIRAATEAAIKGIVKRIRAR